MAEQHRAVAITAVEAALNTVASTFDTDHPDSLKSRSIIDCLRETAQNMNSRGCLDTAIFKLNKFMSDFGNQQVRVSALTGLGRASEETFNELVDAQSLGYYGVLHDFGEQIAQNSSTVACKILVSLRDQIELQYFRPSLPTQTRSSRDPLVHDFDAPSDITQQPSPTLAFPSGADVGRLGTTSAPSMAEPCSNGRSLRGRSTSHADQKSAIQDNLVPPMRTRACRRRLASEERNLNESETRTVMQSIEPIDLTGEDEDSAQSPPSTQIPTKLDTDRASKRQRVEVRVPPPPIVTPPRSESSDSDTSEYIPRLAPPPPTQTDAPAETEQVKKPQPQPQALSPPSERDATSAVASRSKNTGKAASQKAPEPRREKPISHVLDECINIPHELTQSAQAHLPASLRAQPKTLRMPRETCVCCLKAWTSRDDIKHCHFTGARRACDLCHDTRRKFEQIPMPFWRAVNFAYQAILTRDPMAWTYHEQLCKDIKKFLAHFGNPIEIEELREDSRERHKNRQKLGKISGLGVANYCVDASLEGHWFRLMDTRLKKKIVGSMYMDYNTWDSVNLYLSRR